jgi:hypothetical protein
MRLLLMIAIALMATGCAKHPVGAWQPEPPAVSSEIAPPPADASLPRMTFPLHATDAQGRDAEPITMVVAATEAQLIEAFDKAGWMAADPVTPESTERMRTAQIWSDAYPNAPVAPLFYWGREQDAAWQRPGATVASRVRVRVWRSEEQDEQGRWLWALNVAQDEGFIGLPQFGLPVHHMLPSVDDANDILLTDLSKADVTSRQYLLAGIGPNMGFRTASGDPYGTAGWVRVLEL